MWNPAIEGLHIGIPEPKMKKNKQTGILTIASWVGFRIQT